MSGDNNGSVKVVDTSGKVRLTGPFAIRGLAWSLESEVPVFLCAESDPGSEAYRALHPHDTVDVWTFRAQRVGQGLLRYRMGRRWSPAREDERGATFEIRSSSSSSGASPKTRRTATSSAK